MGLDIEAAALDGEALWGLDEDVKKYYDSLVREILWAASEKLGLPEWFVDSQRRFYNELQRCFKYGSALGPWFRTLVSVLQGCALSQIWANVDGSCWAWEIQEKAKVQVGGFIDDKAMRSREKEEVQKGADASTAYHERSGQEVEPTKSAGWCTSRGSRIWKGSA